MYFICNVNCWTVSSGILLGHFRFILVHLTGFSRLLARRGFCLGLNDHKESPTMSSRREKPAFGASNQSICIVTNLARCAASRYGSCLAEWTELRHQMIQNKPEGDVRCNCALLIQFRRNRSLLKIENARFTNGDSVNKPNLYSTRCNPRFQPIPFLRTRCNKPQIKPIQTLDWRWDNAISFFWLNVC